MRTAGASAVNNKIAQNLRKATLATVALMLGVNGANLMVVQSWLLLVLPIARVMEVGILANTKAALNLLFTIRNIAAHMV